MSQLTFKFPFKTKYYEQDFYVSSNNFSAYKLIESWPNWPGKWLNIFGATGSGKTHLSKILEKKIDKIKIIDAYEINNESFVEFDNLRCVIIDNFKNNIDERVFYSFLNHSKQLDNYVVINSTEPLNCLNYYLEDLKSRISSFVLIGIELPTDDLLKVIISKTFSDKQINLSPKISEYIIKNVERSYEKMFKLLKDIDELSLTSGKQISINLVKEVIKK
tara:strand:- start:572 stop:1228 length:657 start_codon:yes stop_codon:yes gene_type:complete